MCHVYAFYTYLRPLLFYVISWELWAFWLTFQVVGVSRVRTNSSIRAFLTKTGLLDVIYHDYKILYAVQTSNTCNISCSLQMCDWTRLGTCRPDHIAKTFILHHYAILTCALVEQENGPDIFQALNHIALCSPTIPCSLAAITVHKPHISARNNF